MATSGMRSAFMVSAGVVGGFLAAQLVMPTSVVPAPTPEPTGREPRVRVAEDPRAPDASVVPASGYRGPSTLAGILRMDSDFEQTAALYELIGSIDLRELERLIAEADSVPGVSDRRAALSILYGRYADLDPAAAVDFLQRRGGSHGDGELRAIFHAWSRKDLTAAVEAASRLPPEARTAAGVAILTSRDDLSSQGQRQIAARLEMEEMLPRIAMQRSLDGVDRDPLSAWQAALAAGDGRHRHQQLAGIAQAWARDDPVAAMNAAMSLADRALRTSLQTQVLHEWSRRFPQEAVEWAMAQPRTPQRQQLTTVALSALAESEPRMAFDLAQTLYGQERAQAVGQVLSRWSEDDPVAAARSIESVTDAGARRNAIGGIASAYVRQDPEGALQWLGTLNPEEASRATLMMFSMLAQQDPAHASSLVSRLPDDNSRAMAADSVARAWAQHDPEATARWVESIADDELRTRAIGGLVGQWAQYDRERALGYAERLPDASQRDAALVAIIQRQHGDLDYAERLFDRLTDPDQRGLAARVLYFGLRESDPRRAERYREMAGFPAEAALSR